MDDLRCSIGEITELTDEYLDNINELTTYGSRGSINMAIDVLEVLRDRVLDGEQISYNGQILTIDILKDIIIDKFTVFIFDSLF